MEQQFFINVIVGATLTITGWFLREMWAAVKELKMDLAKLREELPKTYLAKDDYRRDIDEVKVMLNKIFDKLDTKADK